MCSRSHEEGEGNPFMALRSQLLLQDFYSARDPIFFRQSVPRRAFPHERPKGITTAPRISTITGSGPATKPRPRDRTAASTAWDPRGLSPAKTPRQFSRRAAGFAEGRRGKVIKTARQVHAETPGRRAEPTKATSAHTASPAPRTPPVERASSPLPAQRAGSTTPRRLVIF